MKEAKLAFWKNKTCLVKEFNKLNFILLTNVWGTFLVKFCPTKILDSNV